MVQAVLRCRWTPHPSLTPSVHSLNPTDCQCSLPRLRVHADHSISDSSPQSDFGVHVRCHLRSVPCTLRQSRDAAVDVEKEGAERSRDQPARLGCGGWLCAA